MLQLSIAVRNARLDAFENRVGPSPLLEIRTGLPPANCVAEDTGVLLARMSLPPDWLSPAENGTKAKAGDWGSPSARDSGLASHFRIKDSGGVCHLQGTCSALGGGGDMELDVVNVAAGRRVTVVAFALVDNNP